MGRKKKGELSREQLLKTFDDKKDSEPARLPVPKPKLTTRVKKAKVPAKVEEVTKANLSNENERDEDEDEEVFEDNADEIAYEVDELTRLMSFVGIETDPDLDELDKQTNLAGLR